MTGPPAIAKGRGFVTSPAASPALDFVCARTKATLQPITYIAAPPDRQLSTKSPRPVFPLYRQRRGFGSDFVALSILAFMRH